MAPSTTAPSGPSPASLPTMMNNPTCPKRVGGSDPPALHSPGKTRYATLLGGG
jgi:hypothetical protein